MGKYNKDKKYNIYDPDIECKKLIQRLDRIRLIKKLSMNQLAEKAEMSPSTLNEMFHGRTKPQLYSLYKLCNALEVPIAELLDAKCESASLSELDYLWHYRHLPSWKQKKIDEYIKMIEQYNLLN